MNNAVMRVTLEQQSLWAVPWIQIPVFISSQLSQQMCGFFRFTGYCAPICAQKKKKKGESPEWSFSESVEEQSSTEHSETNQS